MSEAHDVTSDDDRSAAVDTWRANRSDIIGLGCGLGLVTAALVWRATGSDTLFGVMLTLAAVGLTVGELTVMMIATLRRPSTHRTSIERFIARRVLPRRWERNGTDG